MLRYPSFVVGYHSCSRQLVDALVHNKQVLNSSRNPWDWLGHGVYFWEQNLGRAIDYANEVADSKQFNRKRFLDPGVVGALLQLGNCLSLVEDESLKALSEAYEIFESAVVELGRKMPRNDNSIRLLDCAIIEFLHKLREFENKPPFDTVRCAFSEGGPVFPGSGIAARLHIQVCVRNTNMIMAYFLPQPSRG